MEQPKIMQYLIAKLDKGYFNHGRAIEWGSNF